MPHIIRTRKNDIVPNSFTFTPINSASRSTVYDSSLLTLSGTNKNSPFTCTNCTVSVNGGSYVSSGSMPPRATFRLRVTSSSGFSTAVTGTITIGGVTRSFVVTTGGMSYFLVWNNIASQSAGTLSSDTLTANSTAFIYADAVGYPTPTDGNFYYFEASTSGSAGNGYIGVAYSSDGSTVTGGFRYTLATNRGVAMRWYNNAWFVVWITYAGGLSTSNTISRPYCWPSIQANGAGRSVTFLPYASQHSMLPTVSSLSTNASYQAPTYHLLS